MKFCITPTNLPQLSTNIQSMFAACQLKDLNIEDLANLTNKKDTTLSQRDLLNLSTKLLRLKKSTYLRSLSEVAPTPAKLSKPIGGGDMLIKAGNATEACTSASIQKSIDLYLNPDGSVNAAAMMCDWFSDISANVFISHARADKNLALALAGWLRNDFGLVPFIDSCVWNHADDLLWKIDNRWCPIKETASFSYERRNITTAHVHMMLSTALIKMMDRCELVFFLNSPNSICNKSIEQMVDDVDESTHSPWLYHEISMMQLLRRRPKEDHRGEATNFSEGHKRASLDIRFDYPVDLGSLPTVTVRNLKEWLRAGAKRNDALDTLYSICPKAIT